MLFHQNRENDSHAIRWLFMLAPPGPTNDRQFELGGRASRYAQPPYAVRRLRRGGKLGVRQYDGDADDHGLRGDDSVSDGGVGGHVGQIQLQEGSMRKREKEAAAGGRDRK